MLIDNNEMNEILKKYKTHKKLLFSKKSKCLQDLMELMARLDHKVIILWAFDCVKVPLALLEAKYPNEQRPRIAVELCKQWAEGKIKMPVAKKAILECHQVSKEVEDIYYASLCHAIGQAVSSVHVQTHAIGLSIYELSSIVFLNQENAKPILEDKLRYYYQKLQYYEQHFEEIETIWAPFFRKEESKINKQNQQFSVKSRLLI